MRASGDAELGGEHRDLVGREADQRVDGPVREPVEDAPKGAEPAHVAREPALDHHQSTAAEAADTQRSRQGKAVGLTLEHGDGHRAARDLALHQRHLQERRAESLGALHQRGHRAAAPPASVHRVGERELDAGVGDLLDAIRQRRRRGIAPERHERRPIERVEQHNPHRGGSSAVGWSTIGSAAAPGFRERPQTARRQRRARGDRESRVPLATARIEAHRSDQELQRLALPPDPRGMPTGDAQVVGVDLGIPRQVRVMVLEEITTGVQDVRAVDPVQPLGALGTTGVHDERLVERDDGASLVAANVEDPQHELGVLGEAQRLVVAADLGEQLAFEREGARDEASVVSAERGTEIVRGTGRTPVGVAETAEHDGCATFELRTQGFEPVRFDLVVVVEEHEASPGRVRGAAVPRRRGSGVLLPNATEPGITERRYRR